MEDKNIILKNGKKVRLTLEDDNGLFTIWAIDDKNYTVAKCTYEIMHIYSRPLSQQARELYAKKHKTSVDKAPKFLNKRVNLAEKKARDLKEPQTLNSGKDIKPTASENYTIQGETLTLSTGAEYKFNKKICDLCMIKILDEDYYKTGLGSAMYKEMEKIVQAEDCKEIEAYYVPHGAFQDGTHDFYKRNGFHFEKSKGAIYARKDLAPENQKSIEQ